MAELNPKAQGLTLFSVSGKVTIKFQAEDNWDGATGNVFALAIMGGPARRPIIRARSR